MVSFFAASAGCATLLFKHQVFKSLFFNFIFNCRFYPHFMKINITGTHICSFFHIN